MISLYFLDCIFAENYQMLSSTTPSPLSSMTPSPLSSTSTSAPSPESPTAKKSPAPKPILSNCRECGDEASGIHYGVTSCEGCKVNTNRLWILYRCENLQFEKCQNSHVLYVLGFFRLVKKNKKQKTIPRIDLFSPISAHFLSFPYCLSGFSQLSLSWRKV